MFPFDLVTILEGRQIAGLVHICEAPDGLVGNAGVSASLAHRLASDPAALPPRVATP
jgi:hypothetical protein